MASKMLTLVILLSVTVYRTHATASGFVCGGPGWAVDNTDRKEMFVKFQNWLYAWQNSCEKVRYEGNPPSTGIGSTVMGQTNWFEFAIEQNCVYRPTSAYSWASAEPEKCTFQGNPSSDCYFEPLSACENFITGKMMPEYVNTKDRAVLARDLAFCPHATDSCGLAALAKKSLQWVHSNFIYYITRPNSVVQAEILRRGHEIEVFLHSPELRSKHGATLGVHIRGGNPNDGRRTLTIDDYVTAIDAIATELAAWGRPLMAVFLCSDTPETNFISAASMAEKYPRSWRYLAVAQNRQGGRDGEETSWYALGHKGETRELMLEFLTDMHYLSTMDVFLGSHSNVYPVVAGRRIAMWHHAPTATTAPYPHSNSSHNPSHNPSPNPNPSDGASDAGGGAGAGAGPAWHFRVTGTNASTSAGTLSQVPLIQRRNCALLSTPTRLAYVPPAIHCEGSAEVRGLWHIHSKFGYNTDNPSLMEAVAALAPSPDPAP